MRILLTGGTGLIGRALCRQWQAQGHDLVVWSRTPERVARLCAGARGVATLRELEGAPPFDAVINLAGAPIADRPWTAQRRRVLWRSRVDLTRELVEWLGRCERPPRVLLSGSATGWYGDRGQEPLDEDSRSSKDDFGSQLCVAWETEALRAEALGMRVVLLRTAPVLATDGGMLPKLRLPFSMGLGGRLGSGRQWMPWVHLDDMVGLIDFLLHHVDCRGAFNACAPDLVRNADFASTLAATLRRPMLFSIPAWVLRMALGEMSVLLLGSQHLQPRRALEAGYRFRFPYLEEALERLLESEAHPVTRRPAE
ncbi:TIGR01777 family protein [Ralstonia pickettii]|uniref:TIGR01777 family protein n=1 Tax=Ralstonia pickettii TaxID=329 RepID=A0A7X2LBJ3_RALPI|nr:TIGR01777 family oxidoreductase [Ralstonia pickettii]MRT00370.1 TIGR01777 family protein [Ralstonia pickettii]